MAHEIITHQSRTPFLWRWMRKLNRRLATQVSGRGRGPRRVVLLRLKRHPIMMRVMLALEGQWRCRRADLERLAAHKALVAIRPPEKA